MNISKNHVLSQSFGDFSDLESIDSKSDLNALVDIYRAKTECSTTRTTYRECIARACGFNSTNHLISQLPVFYSLSKFSDDLVDSVNKTYPANYPSDYYNSAGNVSNSLFNDCIQFCIDYFATDRDSFIPYVDIDYESWDYSKKATEYYEFIEYMVLELLTDATQKNHDLYTANKKLILAIAVAYFINESSDCSY